MKVLIVKTSSMGDVIHTLPALTDAKNALPHIQFDWVVEENFAEIPSWHFAVDKIIPVAIRRWRKNLLARQTRNEWKNYRTLLQQQQYDAVIDAQGLVKSAFLVACLARGDKHGYDRHSIREPLASFCYDRKYAISYQQHAVERIRQLFAQSLCYSLPKTKGDYGIAKHFLATQTIPYVMFIHATTRAEKHWLDDEWIALAQELVARYPKLEIRLPWSNAQERKRAEKIQSAVKNVNILPKLSLTALAQQLANAKAVVSVDTGLAHLTAALNVPNITLYGATDPDLIGTYGQHQQYLHASTMAHIKAAEVLKKLLLNWRLE